MSTTGRKLNSYPAINYPTMLPYLGCSIGDFVVIVALAIIFISPVGFIMTVALGWKGYLYSLLLALGVVAGVIVFVRENRRKIPKTYEVLDFFWNYNSRTTYLCGYDGKIEFEPETPPKRSKVRGVKVKSSKKK